MSGVATDYSLPVSHRGGWKSTAKRALLRAASVTSRLDRKAGNSVLLTFDDGPHPEVTPAVLDLLKQYDARAVFFVVGNRIPLAPWVLRQILDGGHQIGNHTYYHDYKDRGVSDYVDDIAPASGMSRR